MSFFCSCRICKINSNGSGKWLSTKKTFKKHQEKEKASIEKMSESETESDKFEEDESDESDESDTSSDNSLLCNDKSTFLEDTTRR